MSRYRSPSDHHRNSATILVQLGLIASLLLMIGLFSMQWTSSTPAAPDHRPIEPIEIIAIPPIPVIPDTPPQPPTPLQPPPPIVGDDVPDISLDDPPPWDPTFDPITFGPPPALAVPEVIEPPFRYHESPPEIVGGLEALQRRVRYPEHARQVGIEGIVIVQFDVDEQGVVSDLVCLRDPGGGTCNAAIRAIQRTEFIPGLQNDQPVKVRFSIPIRFRLTRP